MLINGSKPGWDFLRGRMETRVCWFVLISPRWVQNQRYYHWMVFPINQPEKLQKMKKSICFKCPWIGLERKICMDYIPEQGSIRG